MRLGWDAENFTFIEIAKRAEAVGIDAFTLHGRYGKQFYKPSAKWEHIARLKEALHVPVIGNGDVSSPVEAMMRLRETGADGIMVGRAALGNPWLIRDIAAAMRGEPVPAPPTIEERIDFAREHFDAMIERYGERLGLLQMRKHLGWYVKGIHDAGSMRERINKAVAPDAVRALLDEARAAQPAERGAEEHEELAVAM
jgi:nifR3 family TIM-barrel protein